MFGQRFGDKTDRVLHSGLALRRVFEINARVGLEHAPH
jgi:hypothetical protein